MAATPWPVAKAFQRYFCCGLLRPFVDGFLREPERVPTRSDDGPGLRSYRVDAYVQSVSFLSDLRTEASRSSCNR